MHPKHGQVFQKHSPDFSAHVGTSIAINLAYSAIQELGLDVRSSSKNPRWLDKKRFVWNPDVLEDLNESIEQLQADLDEWIYHYNTQRTHQGKICCGRTPFETMIEGKQIWKEKFVNQI